MMIKEQKKDRKHFAIKWLPLHFYIIMMFKLRWQKESILPLIRSNCLWM